MLSFSSSLPFQKGYKLFFPCSSCSQEVSFSIFDLDEEGVLHCKCCNQQFILKDPDLRRQISKFEALCCQIKEAEEILSQMAVGVDIGHHHVEIPYKLLMTRFNSHLQLKIGDRSLTISFRFEPNCINSIHKD